jgi:Heavy-metal resistance
MIGFILGTVCLLGFGKALARHRYGWRSGYSRWGRGGGYGAWHHQHDRDSGWQSRGESWALRPLFEKLETTPGQEKVIVQAFDELGATRKNLRGKAQEWRDELSKALRAPIFDETTVGTLSASIENTFLELRKAGIDAFAKVHDALDDRQRGLLADAVESGFGPLFGMGFGAGPGDGESRGDSGHSHPYRGYGYGSRECGEPRWVRHSEGRGYGGCA